MSLNAYLAKFHRAVGRIDDYGFAESIDINQEIRVAKQAVIKSTIVLIDGSVLHIRLPITGQRRKTDIQI